MMQHSVISSRIVDRIMRSPFHVQLTPYAQKVWLLVVKTEPILTEPILTYMLYGKTKEGDRTFIFEPNTAAEPIEPI